MQATKNEQSIGNSISHDYMSCLFPHIEKWRADYGPVFAFTQGNMVIVCVCDFDVAREFCQCKSAEFGRSAYLRKNRGIVLGYDSLVTSKEKSWALHRKVIAPEFFSDQIKGMVDMMVEFVARVGKMGILNGESRGSCFITDRQGFKKPLCRNDFKSMFWEQ